MSFFLKIVAVFAAAFLAFRYAREIRELFQDFQELVADRTTTSDDVDLWEVRNFGRITKLEKLGLADGLIRQLRAFTPA